MNYVQLILGIFGIIQQILPLLTSSSGGTQAGNTITTIVGQLENWLPTILKEVTALYDPVKNIINALSSSPATTDDALQKLAVLDSQVDAAFEAAAKDVDPDAAPTASA